jgi:hypothetical protein
MSDRLFRGAHPARWAVALLWLAVANGGTPTDAQADRAAEYAADVPKTILELQQHRRVTSASIGRRGQRPGTVTLTEINPRINAWLVLTLHRSAPAEDVSYHLENPEPHSQRIELVGSTPEGLQLTSNGREIHCALWTNEGPGALEQAQRTGLPFAPLCDGRLYLRNAVPGTYSQLEKITNFLRDHVWGGDQIVTFVRKEFFRDAFAEKSGQAPASATGATTAPTAAPMPALLGAAESADAMLVSEHLGIDLVAPAEGLVAGEWYAVRHAPGIFVSAITPQRIASEVLRSFPGAVNSLDSVEASAVDYLVAFDLSEFDLGFALGTDHPRLGWSGRERADARNESLPGPDGIDSAAPLVRNGIVSPALIARTAATFAGGFKREHSAFRYGPLASGNHGSHYGFIEQGAVFSKLQPGLATLYVLEDGAIDMKTWAKEDDDLLVRIRHARQNGPPLIEYDTATTRARPGSLVTQWGAGNWSGSADEKLRTLRAGVCLQQTAPRRFLIYGYFSTATPSAMVRVFQAYGCQYAMHLDMNALEHTYLALYTRDDGRFLVQHLIEGMDVLDRKRGRELAPRFLSFPDNRDFFYVVRRNRNGR